MQMYQKKRQNCRNLRKPKTQTTSGLIVSGNCALSAVGEEVFMPHIKKNLTTVVILKHITQSQEKEKLKWQD